MARSEDSALIALAQLQDMERDRKEHEQTRRLAERERLRQEQLAQERRVREAEQHAQAEQAALREQAEQQRVREAEQSRLRIAQVEARARAEQDARLADVQRELSAALDRKKMHRTGRLAALGLGTALLATAGVFAVWMQTSRPTQPAVAALDDLPDVDALSRRLDRMRQNNATLRGDLSDVRARAAAAVAAAEDALEEGEAAATAEPTATTKPRVRRSDRSNTRRTSPQKATPAEPAIKKRDRPLVLGGDDDLLAGLKKKDETKQKKGKKKK